MADETNVETTTDETPAADPAAQENSGSETATTGSEPEVKAETPAQKAKREVDEDEYAVLEQARRFKNFFNDNAGKDPRKLFEAILKANPEMSKKALYEILDDDYAQVTAAEAEKARLEAMTPAEKRAYELEQQLKKYKDQEEAARAEADEQDEIKEEERISDLVQKSIQLGGFPQTPLVGWLATRAIELADEMEEKTGKKIELTPELIANFVEVKLQENAFAHIDTLKGKTLLDKLGPKRLTAIREALREEVESARSKGVFTAPNKAAKADQPAKPGPRSSFDIVREFTRDEPEKKDPVVRKPKTAAQIMREFMRGSGDDD
jgi:hypothetical protein